jgi:hypothetical protein
MEAERYKEEDRLLRENAGVAQPLRPPQRARALSAAACAALG